MRNPSFSGLLHRQPQTAALLQVGQLQMEVQTLQTQREEQVRELQAKVEAGAEQQPGGGGGAGR